MATGPGPGDDCRTSPATLLLHLKSSLQMASVTPLMPTIVVSEGSLAVGLVINAGVRCLTAGLAIIAHHASIKDFFENFERSQLNG